MAAASSVPVINALTDQSHPCQIMADILTFEERIGSIIGETIAWVGDGNNVANSWIHAAGAFGFKLRIACPEGFEPDPAAVDWARKEDGLIEIVRDPKEAVKGAQAIVTDTWVSMGDTNAAEKLAALGPYQVDAALMAETKKSAVFMHCLPAHRGEEVSAEVIDGRQSVVWDEAENRLHAQKAILGWAIP